MSKVIIQTFSTLAQTEELSCCYFQSGRNFLFLFARLNGRFDEFDPSYAHVHLPSRGHDGKDEI